MRVIIDHVPNHSSDRHPCVESTSTVASPRRTAGPMVDFGYDVADYTGVAPIFGTLDEGEDR